MGATLGTGQSRGKQRKLIKLEDNKITKCKQFNTGITNQYLRLTHLLVTVFCERCEKTIVFYTMKNTSCYNKNTSNFILN